MVPNEIVVLRVLSDGSDLSVQEILDAVLEVEGASPINPATAFRIVNRLEERGFAEATRAKRVPPEGPDGRSIRSHRRFSITDLGKSELARRAADQG